MYIQKIAIKINTKADKNELMDEFGNLIACYRNNGQIQGKDESLYLSKDKMVCLPFTLEKNSLHQKFNNVYVNQQIEKIEQLCEAKLKYKTVGKTHTAYQSPCQCQKSDFYILFTHYLTIESPITCGNCNHSVPLYRLPKFENFGYWSILKWDENYKACDTLQMSCEVGERWGINQMQDIHSQLSKQGMTICAEIEALTAIPTYYFLHDYRKYKSKQATKTCPSCGGKWDLATPLHDFYDFKCDQCKIVSIISQNC